MAVKVADAITEFAQFSKGTGMAVTTVNRHRKALGQFLATCQSVKGNNPTMGQVDHSVVGTHFAALGGEQGNRNNHIGTLRSFLRWADKRHYLRPGLSADGLLDGYKNRKASRQPKLYIPAERFAEVLAAAEAHTPRDRAAVAIGLYTLARQSEISLMRLKDVDMAGRSIQIYRQKTRRHTTTGITPELHDELQGWLQTYALAMGYPSAAGMMRKRPDWYLTPARPRGGGSHTRLTFLPDAPLVAMEKLVHRTLGDMGYTPEEMKGEGMHTWRRSGGRALFDHLTAGLGYQGALVQVAAALDHDDTKMTLHYIGRDHIKDELNNWLRGNSMYGTAPAPDGAKILPFQRRTA